MKALITINALLISFALFLFCYCYNRDCMGGEICGDCGQRKCIYVDIEKRYDESHLTLDQAIKEVCKERGITDTNTIKLISANY